MYEDLRAVLKKLSALEPRIARILEGQRTTQKECSLLSSRLDDITNSLQGDNQDPGVFETIRSLNKEAEVIQDRISQNQVAIKSLEELQSEIRLNSERVKKISKGLYAILILVLTSVVSAVLNQVL
jgi:chromosome segregation ATPase